MNQNASISTFLLKKIKKRKLIPNSVIVYLHPSSSILIHRSLLLIYIVPTAVLCNILFKTIIEVLLPIYYYYCCTWFLHNTP